VADPKYVPAYNTLALVHMALKEDDKAQKRFEQALKIDPTDSDVNNNYGMFLCDRKREKESVKYFMAAIRNPLYGRAEDAYVNAGICSRRSGDNAAANEFFQRALKLKPDDARALINLSQLDFARGDLGQAKANLTRYMQAVAAPDAGTLLFGARLSARLGDRNALASYGSQLRSRFPGSPETRAFDEGRLE
jgi:type IV pilus assembly protein PilF